MRVVFKIYEELGLPKKGNVQIYDQPGSLDEGTSSIQDIGLESQNEEACLRYRSIRNRQMRCVRCMRNLDRQIRGGL